MAMYIQSGYLLLNQGTIDSHVGYFGIKERDLDLFLSQEKKQFDLVMKELRH